MGRFNNLSYTTSYFFYVDNERGLNKISSLMEILTNKEEGREKLKNNPLQAAHLLDLMDMAQLNTNVPVAKHMTPMVKM